MTEENKLMILGEMTEFLVKYWEENKPVIMKEIEDGGLDAGEWQKRIDSAIHGAKNVAAEARDVVYELE